MSPPGLWLWHVQYVDWPRGDGWDGKVASTCVESGGEIVLLDPVAPAQGGSKLWSRLDARPPTLIVILKAEGLRARLGADTLERISFTTVRKDHRGHEDRKNLTQRRKSLRPRRI